MVAPGSLSGLLRRSYPPMRAARAADGNLPLLRHTRKVAQKKVYLIVGRNASTTLKNLFAARPSRENAYFRPESGSENRPAEENA